MVYLPRAEKKDRIGPYRIRDKVNGVCAGAVGKQQQDKKVVLVRPLYKLVRLQVIRKSIKVKVLAVWVLPVKVLDSEYGKMLVGHALLAVEELSYAFAF